MYVRKRFLKMGLRGTGGGGVGREGKQRMGEQRGAGENGVLRGEGKTRINFAPCKLTRTTYLTTQKRMHNTQALRGLPKKAGTRSDIYSKTPPAYISATGMTMGAKLIGT